MVTSLSLLQYEARARRRFTGVPKCVLNVFTADTSEKLITYGLFVHPRCIVTVFTGVTSSSFFSFFWRNPRFSFLFPPPFFSSTKSLQTPTSHWSPLRFCATASTHPLNRTCHGCACPLTKDNCDLDKHWGIHKGKGQVLFQFKCAPIHLQHNGDKEVAATSVSKGGHVIIRLMEEEEDADSTPDLDDNKKRREETTNQKEMR